MKKCRLLLLLAVIGFVLPLDVDAASKKNVYIFKGATCAFCKKALSFFQELVNDGDYADKFDLVEYEVWNNEENARLGKDVASELGEEMDGVPYIIIGDQTFSGYTTSYDDQIKSAIDDFYNDDSAVSVVERVRGNGDYDVTPEYTLNKSDSNAGGADEVIAVIIIVVAILGFGYVVYLSRKDSTSKYYEKPIKKVVSDSSDDDGVKKSPSKKNSSNKKSSSKKK